MRKYIETALMTAKSQTNGGIVYLIPGYLLKVVYLVPLILLWRTLMAGGVDTGMTTGQMLTYTYIGALLGELLIIQTTLTRWLYEGQIISLYQRPMSLYSHVVAQTLGINLPQLILFSLPMAFLSPLFGVSLHPASLWFIPSLVLCVSLGFAIDFLFACLLIRMMNVRWLVISIRSAVSWLLSGTFIPFMLLPWGIGNIFAYLPMGSLGGATLAIYTGMASPLPTLAVQLIWNLILWPVAYFTFEKARERMVSHGG